MHTHHVTFLIFSVEKNVSASSKIPSYHPSLFVQVKENENVGEKFKEGMMSVCNILALYQLKPQPGSLFEGDIS